MTGGTGLCSNMVAALSITRLGSRTKEASFPGKGECHGVGQENRMLLVPIATPGKTHIMPMMVMRSSWKARL